MMEGALMTLPQAMAVGGALQTGIITAFVAHPYGWAWYDGLSIGAAVGALLGYAMAYLVMV